MSEGVRIVEHEHAVVRALEADGREGVAGEPAAADRAAVVARVDEHVVGELEQAEQAGVKRTSLALAVRRDVEIRPPDIADEQRVAREYEPWLVGATPAVGHRVRVMGRCVTRRRDGRNDRVSELDHVPVVERDMVEADSGAGRQVGGRTRALDERRQARHVVRLHVRLEDGDDRRADRIGRREVLRDELLVRIHDGKASERGAPEQVARARRCLEQERPENHARGKVVPGMLSSPPNMAMRAIGGDVERSMLAALWDTTRMRLLVALANEGSVSAAARAIGITQSTASEHVRVLEVATQQPLVERFGRGSRLTEAGRALARRAAAALAELAAGEDEIAELAGLQGGRVALAASSSPGAYVLPYTLGCFRHEYPGVSVDLEIAPSADVIEWVLAGRVGVAVVGAEPDDERLEVQPFCEDEIVGVARPGLLAIEDGRVSAAALSAETLLAGETGSSTQALADDELRAAGVRPKTVWRLGSGEGVKRSAQEGLGFAFLSRFAVVEELDQGRLHSFRISGRKPLRRRFNAVRLAGRELPPAEARFLSTLWTCCSTSPAFAEACILPRPT